MSRKLYFGGSVRGGRQDQALYDNIITLLKKYGQVLTAEIGQKDILEKEIKREARAVHDECLGWLEEADAVIAEVTQPSLGVGYEIGKAELMGKKILCLFRPEAAKGNLSCMIDGAHDGQNLVVKYYKEDDLPGILREFFANL